MSARNGDGARFHKDRKRKLLHRQRVEALIAGQRKRRDEAASSPGASRGVIEAIEPKAAPAEAR